MQTGPRVSAGLTAILASVLEILRADFAGEPKVYAELSLLGALLRIFLVRPEISPL